MTVTDDDCGAIDMNNSYDATEDVLFLARRTHERDVRRSGRSTHWDELPPQKQTEYVANAGWTIHMLIGLRGYRTPGGKR